MEDTDRAQHERENSPNPPIQLAEQRRSQVEEQTTKDIFDPSSASQRLGGERLLRKIIVLFLKNIPNVLEEVNASIAVSDGNRLERSAHSLASSLAYLSARLASDAALVLEQMGHNSDFSTATSASERLHLEVKRLRMGLTEFVSKENAPRES